MDKFHPRCILSVLLFEFFERGRKTGWSSPAQEWGNLGAAALS